MGEIDKNKNLNREIFYTVAAFLMPLSGLLFLFFMPIGERIVYSPSLHFGLFVATASLSFYIASIAFRDYQKSRDPRVFIVSLAFFVLGLVFVLQMLAISGLFAVDDTLFDVVEHYGFFFYAMAFSALLAPSIGGDREGFYRRRFVMLGMVAAGIIAWFLALAAWPILADFFASTLPFCIGLTGVLFFVSMVFLFRQYSGTRNHLLLHLIFGIAVFANCAIAPFFYEEWNMLWWYFQALLLVGLLTILFGITHFFAWRSMSDGERSSQDGFDTAFVPKVSVYSKISTRVAILFLPLILIAIFTLYNNRLVIARINIAREHTLIETQKIILATRLNYLTILNSRSMFHSLEHLRRGDRDGVMHEMEEMDVLKDERMRLVADLRGELNIERISVGTVSGASDIDSIESKIQVEDAKDTEIMEIMMAASDGDLSDIAMKIEEELHPLTDELDSIIGKFTEDRRVEIDQRQADIRRAEDEGRVSLMIVSVIGVALVVFLFFFILRLLNPISALTEVALSIAGGNLKKRAEVHSRDEIGMLGESFNKMTENLMVARKYPEHIIRSMADSLILVGMDGTVKETNQATGDLLGYDKEELIGMAFSVIVGDLSSMFKDGSVAEIAGKGTLHNIELSYKTKSGEYIPVIVSGATMTDDADAAIGVIFVAKDMRVMKAQEAKLRLSEQQLRESNQQLQASQKQLEEKISELQRFNDVVIDRELKMIELKEKLKSVERREGEGSAR